ncbi:hypothetical protein ACHAXR_010289 [Thalassiosira sp. AJA248-18]
MAENGEDENPSAPPRFRSANDHEHELSLRAALTESPFIHHSSPNEIKIGPCVMDGNLSSICCDWQTAKLDLSTSHPQSMEEEVKRLMELKRFAILESDHEDKFERITALASRIFDVPICLVSLVDIGRQWFMSNRGLGEVRETSREVSFCAHAILSKQDLFIVPDTYEDPRFKENGLVTGGPFIRFYAGSPLVTPGGYKIGTFCIIDRKPRPMGLSLNEKQNLRELTEMVMDTMVHRKKEMQQLMDEKTRIIACAAHDLLSPLTGIQLNLGLLMEDETLGEKLDSNQKELLEASVTCSDMIESICVRAIESFRGEMKRSHESTLSEEENKTNEKGLVNVDQLVDNVERVVGTLPKKVPCFIEKDDNVPLTIVSDDLKLFRSMINYLSNACKQTQTGLIRLRIYVRKAAESATNMELDWLPGALVAPNRDSLIVEVHDTGPGIDLEKYPALFTPNANVGQGGSSKMSNSGLGLFSVATEISSIDGGEYGVFPRQDLVASHPDYDNGSLDQQTEPNISGCVFWFSVPLVLPSGSPAASPSSQGSKKRISQDADMENKGDVDSRMSDESKLMPAPAAVPVKRPSTGFEGRSHMAKKVALSSSLVMAPDNSLISGKLSDDISMLNSLEETPKRAKRVLIIDDSMTIRKGLARGFSRLGFEVEEAENGLEGFKKLKSGLYELVLLDFLMPVMDGPDVARKFRAWEQDYRPNFKQYIIGISAHANGKDAELGLKAGMDRFMGKPVPLKSLKDLAQCKPVLEASALLDIIYQKSCDAMESVSKLAEARSDEGCSRSARSSASSSTSTFTKQSCLIVTKESDPNQRPIQLIVEKHGWRAVVVNGGGEDALRLLKLRNWDTVRLQALVCSCSLLSHAFSTTIMIESNVFIDNDLPIFSGTNCLIRFRDWEKRSRSVKQKNVFIISDTCVGRHSIPSGFNGVLSKPVEPAQVLQILETASLPSMFGTINVRR